MVTTGVLEHCLVDLAGIGKSDLCDERGVFYQEFRRRLQPNRLRVGLDIALGLSALAITGWLTMVALDVLPRIWPILAALAAFSFGYWMAYLQLFIHEAAHFNLVDSRVWNDRIANLLIGVWVGVRIENYRAIHWEHHRMHGEPADTEHSYFSSLNAQFLAETLLGIKALKVIVWRRRALVARAGNPGLKPVSGISMLAWTIATHALVIALLVSSGYWQVAVAWAAGVGMFFPFFGALRQLLEHRGEHARVAIDYLATPHGRTTRLFREGLFGSTFGGAGFTRHLLHHWDPSVSYTNLADVEKFLGRCTVTHNIVRQKASYWSTLLRLYGQ